jgi:hypothetical protein
MLVIIASTLRNRDATSRSLSYYVSSLVLL